VKNRRWFPSLVLTFALLSGCGGSPEKRILRGIQLLEAGNHARAQAQLEKGLRAAPDTVENAAAWNALGLVRAHLGDSIKAAEAFQKSATLDPSSFPAHYNRGQLYLQEKKLAEASESFRRADAADPGRTEALEMLANIALSQQDAASARTLLEQALARAGHPRVLNALALVRRQTGSAPGEVRELLQKAVVLDPTFAVAQVNLAALLDANRLDTEQAVTHYEAYLRLQPESPKSFAVRQRLQVLAERIQTGGVAAPDPIRVEVTSLLEQATEASRSGFPDRALHLCLRAATAASRAQRPDLEERALRAAATLAPESARAQVGLGRFLLQQNQAAHALAPFQKAVALAPTWLPALQGLTEAAVANRQNSLARDVLQASEQSARDNAELLFGIAVLYQDVLQDRNRSKRVLDEWLRRFPTHEKAAEARTRLR
jgi:tetratricopeptide (TPR) repeat protein